ncbi:MAG: MerR family transcriptional regulator [Pseudonocardiaceae bacterium]
MGELARATGLSVRTLRHWDQVGLVCPRRARAGHRCYSRADVTRLYRALALRSMGLSLEQIGALLAETDPSPPDVAPTLIGGFSATVYKTGNDPESIRGSCCLDLGGVGRETKSGDMDVHRCREASWWRYGSPSGQAWCFGTSGPIWSTLQLVGVLPGHRRLAGTDVCGVGIMHRAL